MSIFVVAGITSDDGWEEIIVSGGLALHSMKQKGTFEK